MITLVTTHPDKRTAADTALLKELCARCPDLELLCAQVRWFDGQNADTWVEDAVTRTSVSRPCTCSTWMPVKWEQYPQKIDLGHPGGITDG